MRKGVFLVARREYNTGYKFLAHDLYCLLGLIGL